MPDFEVIFMDAGQGDCTLIVYPDNSLTLVDCGSTKSGKEAFAEIQKVLNRYLEKNYNLVLTHPDQDHYNQLRFLADEDYHRELFPNDITPRPSFGHVYYGGDI